MLTIYLFFLLSGFSKGYREAFSNGEQEPWIFRGGLCGDLQRLLPIENINDLFLYKAPDNPTSHVYTIRPYVLSDEPCVYEICKKVAALSIEGDLDGECGNLLGDKLVGSFLTLSPEYCFVVENEDGLCGYLLGAPDTRQFEKKLQLAWIPDLLNKYPAPVDKIRNGDQLTLGEKMIQDLHDQQTQQKNIPNCVYNNHPSICRLGLLEHVIDTSVPKRLMSCLMAALKANGKSTFIYSKSVQLYKWRLLTLSGSNGLFSVVNSETEKHSLDYYSKLGFQEIQFPDENKYSETEVFLGRQI